MKLGSQKEARYVNCASAEGKAIKRHPFQMSNAWEKVVGSQSLLSLPLAEPTFCQMFVQNHLAGRTVRPDMTQATST